MGCSASQPGIISMILGPAFPPPGTCNIQPICMQSNNLEALSIHKLSRKHWRRNSLPQSQTDALSASVKTQQRQHSWTQHCWGGLWQRNRITILSMRRPSYGRCAMYCPHLLQYSFTLFQCASLILYHTLNRPTMDPLSRHSASQCDS